MALANYTDLKTSITSWMTRSDMGGFAEDFITLAEARLNRELNPVETDATITGTIDARTIDVSAQSVEEAIALFLVNPDTGDERKLTPKGPGEFAYANQSGEPDLWTLDGSTIKFNCPLDRAYSFRFRFTQRFKLSDDAPTNWLLTYHPDIYLSATLIWGNILKRASDEAAPFMAVLADGIPAVRHTLSQSKRAVLTVDPALAAVNSSGGYDWRTGE